MNRNILLATLLIFLCYQAECQNDYPKFLYSAKDTVNPVGWITNKGDTSLGMSPRRYRKVDKLITKYHEMSETIDTLQAVRIKLKDVRTQYRQIRKLNKQRNEELETQEKEHKALITTYADQVADLERKLLKLKITIGLISGGAAAVIAVILLVLLL